MNFEFGNKGYSFGIITIVCWVINLVLTVLGISGTITAILGIAIIVCGILAFTNGKKELAADPTNNHAQLGRNVGLVIIVMEIIQVIAIIGITAGLIALGTA